MANDLDDDLSLDNTMEEATPYGDFSNKVKTGIGAWFTKEVDKSFFAQPLAAFNKCLPIDLHFTEEGPVVCKKSKVLTADPANTKCEGCLLKDTFDKSGKKFNKPAACLAIPMYFFNSVGNVESYTDKDGKLVEYNDNPTKFAFLKRGKNDVNLESMKDYNDQEELMINIWELKRYPKELKKAISPAIASKKKVDKLFQHIGGATVPPDVLERFENMTREEVRGLAINIHAADKYGAIDWNNQHMLKYVVKPLAETAAVEDAVTGKSSIDLAAALDG